MANVYDPREWPGRGDGEHRDGQVERLLALDGLRLLDGLDVEAGHGAEAPVGHLAGVRGAHVHGDVEVPGHRRDAAEVVEVAVRDEHGRRREPELGERLDDDVGLVAGVDDQPLLALDDDEAVGLQRAERDGEDFDGIRHGYLEWVGVRHQSVSDGAEDGRPRGRTPCPPAGRHGADGAPYPPTTRYAS